MQTFIYWIPVLFLVTLSLIDIKTFNMKGGVIPSVITTSFLIVSFLLRLNPTLMIISFLFALIFFDLELFDGMPDIKAFTASAAILPTIYYICIFGLLLTCLSVIYKFFLKKHGFKEIPFLPVIAIAYIGSVYSTPYLISIL